MPIAICRACKSYAGKAINYITNEKKSERIYTHGLDESRSLSQQFIDTAKLYGKGENFDERKYYHLKFSFEPKDRIENGGKLDAELAEKIANEYLQKHYSGNEYVLAIHTDKEHIHAHAIINAVSFENGKKIQHSNRDLANMKDEINDISEKYEISRFDWKQAVKEKRQSLKQERAKEPKELTQAEKYIRERCGDEWTANSWKDTLRSKIDEAKEICSSRTELQEYLQENYGIEMPRNTKGTVSFKHPAVDVVVRGAKLGADYTAKTIDESMNFNLERGISYAKLRPTEETNRADSERKIKRDEQSQQNGTREQPAERELNGVHSSIREIEERTKHFSGTGREEIRERQRAEQAKRDKLAREQREKAERIEQQRKQFEKQQQTALRSHRSHDRGIER